MTPLLAALIVFMVALGAAAVLVAIASVIVGARYDRRFDRPQSDDPFGDVQWPPHA